MKTFDLQHGAPVDKKKTWCPYLRIWMVHITLQSQCEEKRRYAVIKKRKKKKICMKYFGNTNNTLHL